MNIPALYAACAGRLCVYNNKCRLVDGVHLSSFPYLTIEASNYTVVANLQKEFAKKSAVKKNNYLAAIHILTEKQTRTNYPSVFLWFINIMHIMVPSLLS